MSPRAEPKALKWAKTSENRWCKLREIELAFIKAKGVYVVWHGGFPTRVVKVGHGTIAEELAASRRDPRVTDYAKDGTLFVTWASADASDAAGIARHLAEILRPLVADPAADADAAPIAANSPF